MELSCCPGHPACHGSPPDLGLPCSAALTRLPMHSLLVSPELREDLVRVGADSSSTCSDAMYTEQAAR